MNVAAIVLAAGGGPEGADALRPVDGGTAVAVVLRTLAAVPVETVILVVGKDEDRMRAGTDLGGARIVRGADQPGSPMIASIRAGLDALPGDSDGALIWPVDRSLVAIRTIRALLGAFEEGAGIVIPVCSFPGDEEGRRGHPVLFSRRLFESLRAAPDEEGAVSVVHGHPEEVLEVPVNDRGVVVDTGNPDTRALLAKSRARAHRLRQEAEKTLDSLRKRRASRKTNGSPARKR